MTRLVIGTRGSALALWQAEHIAARLRDLGASEVVLQVIKTTGDKILDVPLARVGGKGLFVKEIEEALLREEVDLAVHSIKDVPAELPAALMLGAIPEREDSRDALVLPASSPQGALSSLAHGARVGTSSLRRRCQLLASRPDLQVLDLRGNVDTRLRKLDEGQYDAIVLAAAGLRRLGHARRISQCLDAEGWVSAVGQGALGIEVRRADARVRQIVGQLQHPQTAVCVGAERSFLLRLGGGCQVPVAAQARLHDGRLTLEGLIGHPAGSPVYRETMSAQPDQAEALGRSLAEQLLERGAQAVLDQVYGSS